MLKFQSERGLRSATIAMLAVFGLAVAAFYVAQNQLGAKGGAVALSKAVWLGLAMWFWLALPLLICADQRLPAVQRRPFLALLVLMALRGFAELWMLYVFHNWSPWYGISHDLLCAVVVVALTRVQWPAAFSRQGDRAAWLARHALFTASLFAAEIYYAWYMQANFRTQGAGPIYFVPDDGQHAVVLAMTAAVDWVSILWLGLFLYHWLHGQANRERS